MNNLFLSYFKKNIVISIGVLLTLILSTFLIFTFGLLLANTIYAYAYKDVLELTNPLGPLTFFNGIVGIIFFVSIFSIFSLITLSISLRDSSFKLLRIIGISHTKLRVFIFLEIFIYMTIAILFSFFLNIPFANFILKELKNKQVIESNFKIYNEYSYHYIFVLATILITMLSTYFSTKRLRKITSVSFDIPESKKKRNLRIIFSSIFSLIFIALLSNSYTMRGGLGLGLLIIVIINFVFAFSLIGKKLLCYFLKLFNKRSKSIYKTIVLESLIKNINKIFVLINLLMAFSMFAYYIYSTYSFSAVEKNNSQNNRGIYILLIINSIFGLIVFTNTLVAFFTSQESNYKVIYKIGFSKKQIMFVIIITNFVITLISLFVSTLFFSIFIFCYYGFNASNFNLLKLFENIAIINILILLVTTLLVIPFCIYNNKKLMHKYD